MFFFNYSFFSRYLSDLCNGIIDNFIFSWYFLQKQTENSFLFDKCVHVSLSLIVCVELLTFIFSLCFSKIFRFIKQFDEEKVHTFSESNSDRLILITSNVPM